MRIISEKELLELLTCFELKEYTPRDDNTREALLEKICACLHENIEVIKKELKTDIGSILYSQYYWFLQYKKEVVKNHGYGMYNRELAKLTLIEDRWGAEWNFNIDWDVIDKIEENEIKENDTF